jgi:hypothetical protein
MVFSSKRSPSPFTGEWHAEPLARAKSHLYLTFSSLASNTDKRQSRLFPGKSRLPNYMNQQIRSLHYSPLDLSAALRPRDGIVKKRRTNKLIIQTFNTPGANLCNPCAADRTRSPFGKCDCGLTPLRLH